MEGSDPELIKPKKGCERRVYDLIEGLEKLRQVCKRQEITKITETIEAYRKLLAEKLENEDEFQAKFNAIKEQNLYFLANLHSKKLRIIRRHQLTERNC